ncbi:MAG: serine--tRNA ligase [Candidatus Paceibacterota bacterium]
MLDIKFIKENKSIIEDAIAKKGLVVDVEALLSADKKRLLLLGEVEKKRAKQNEVSAEIAKSTDPAEKQERIQEMQELKKDLQKKESALKETMKKWRTLILQIPNIPDASVPIGKSEEDNVEEATGGEKPSFSFPPKNHRELMKNLDMVDFEAGSKVHGFRGYFLKNDGAELSWALWNYARDFFGQRGFTPVIAPAIVRQEYFYATGHLPTDADDLYKTQDDDYLSGTAEVPLMAYHADEILKKEDLPKRYLAFSPCYRREAGSYGKDTKGLVRVHEFFKFEQLILCEASHETSVLLHEEINKNMEEFVASLSLPWRRLAISTGDLKTAQVKSYDTEVWIPSENAYREMGSASYYHDFQSRRFNIKYDDKGTKRYVHSLNATALATPRILVALIENNQQKDGGIALPPLLQKYMGKESIPSRS